MRAWCLDPSAGDGRLERASRPEPEAGPGEVMVRMRAASLNYRDLLVADNVYGSKASSLVPLSDGAGEIVALGAGVTSHRIGDRVAGAFYPDWIGGPITAAARIRSPGATVDGMLAEFVCLPAHAAIPVPSHLSDEEAAALPCAAVTAWNAMLETARVKTGDTVLLQGTGGVSLMALQLARLMGVRVIQSSSDAAKRERLKTLGADEVIDYKATPDWHEEVLRLTDGRGVDAIVEVGGPPTLERSFKAVRVGGTIVTVGFVGGDGAINPRALIGRAITLAGITVGSCAMFHEMNRAIALSGMRPVIDRVFAFEHAAEAHAHLRSGRHFGKVVVKI